MCSARWYRNPAIIRLPLSSNQISSVPELQGSARFCFVLARLRYDSDCQPDRSSLLILDQWEPLAPLWQHRDCVVQVNRPCPLWPAIYYRPYSCGTTQRRHYKKADLHGLGGWGGGVGGSLRSLTVSVDVKHHVSLSFSGLGFIKREWKETD